MSDKLAMTRLFDYCEWANHVTNHGSYHRGQVAVFLRQLGLTPPTTDLVVFDRERTPPSAAPGPSQER